MGDKDKPHAPFTRVLTKHAGRARERLLQNFGKVDRTTDEDFDICVKNFTRQQSGVSRLQRELKNYQLCLKAMQAARRSLLETVCELYEPCWLGLNNVMTKADMLNQNYEEALEKIDEKVLTPVASYAAKFPELNNKIAKRNRKLLDYDNSRHNFENLDSMKKREETKILKAKEQYEEKRKFFEIINSELHDELPALYDSRVKFFVTHLQSLFTAEEDFHARDSILLGEMHSILDKLEETKHNSEVLETFFNLPVVESNTSSVSSDLQNADKPVTTEVLEEFDGREKKHEDLEITGAKFAVPEVPKEKNRDDNNQEKDGYSSGSTSGSCFSTPPTTNGRNTGPDITSELGATESEIQITENSFTDYKVLYKVRSTHAYNAEDVDELSFKVGDIIDVVKFDDPEDQEEGWLLGILNGAKGLFPANFTIQI